VASPGPPQPPAAPNQPGPLKPVGGSSKRVASLICPCRQGAPGCGLLLTRLLAIPSHGNHVHPQAHGGADGLQIGAAPPLRPTPKRSYSTGRTPIAGLQLPHQHLLNDASVVSAASSWVKEQHQLLDATGPVSSASSRCKIKPSRGFAVEQASRGGARN